MMDGHVTLWTTMEFLVLVFVCVVSTTGDSGQGVVTVAVAEGEEAILPCLIRSRENIERMVFDWTKAEEEGRKEVFLYDAGPHYNNGRDGQDTQFKGRVFHFDNELKYGNASIRVRKTRMDDGGRYVCTFPRRQVSYVTLVVGAAPEPNIMILGQTADGVKLQCSVKGAFPKPVVHFQDRAGNIVPAEEPQVSERGGSYDIILQTTVTKTDYYQCVATQEEIKHTIYTETYVIAPHDNHTGWIVGGVSIFLVVVLVVVLVIYQRKLKKLKSELAKSNRTSGSTGQSGENQKLVVVASNTTQIAAERT